MHHGREIESRESSAGRGWLVSGLWSCWRMVAFRATAISCKCNSAGKTYEEEVQGRWEAGFPIPEAVKGIVVQDASKVEEVAGTGVDFIFCAVDMRKEEIQALEEQYAKTGTPVVSNNSAHGWTPDVPMVIPELNPHHLEVIEAQRKRLGTTGGFVLAVKPNCSIQSYVPQLHALLDYKPTQVVVSTYQAISGAGKNFNDWPEMVDNVIPYIGGEEEKSEQEPLRIWGEVSGGEIVKASAPVISAQCIRVPVTDGHLATVSVSFEKKKPAKDEMIQRWVNFKGRPAGAESAERAEAVHHVLRGRPTTHKRNSTAISNAAWA